MENHPQVPNFFPGIVINYDDELCVKETEKTKDENLENNIGQNGNIVANQYELVRNILLHLPMKDLMTCCKVCKLWHDIGNLVMKEKSKFDSQSFYWCKDEPADVSFYSQFSLFQSPHHKEMYNNLDKFLGEMTIKPKMAVVLGSGDTDLSVRDSNPGMEPEDHMDKSWLVDKEGITKRLPKGCHAIGSTNRGIIGVKAGEAFELENNYDDENNLLCPAVSIMFIPEKPGCKIMPFHLAENLLDGVVQDIKKNSVYLEDEAVLQERILEKVLPDLKPSDNIKAVILLSNGLDLPFSMHIIQAVSRRSKNKVAIGGAVGDLCWSSMKETSMLALMRELFYYTNQSVPVAENSYMSTSGFVIAGDNVQAASVLLQRKVRSEKKVMDELLKLKQSGISEDNSFAFMFACCGRGERHYRGKKNLEAGTFIKMFPKTPLIGIYGDGELGISFLPNFNSPEPENADTEAPKSSTRESGPSVIRPGQFLHSFTTIFVMVSFGNSKI